MTASPSLDLERELFASGARVLASIDEVGRGAIAGPVTVGVVVITEACGEPPAGVRDSKLLTPARRLALIEPIIAWSMDHAVESASNTEIDELGIIGALRLAGMRALIELDARGTSPDLVLLDGSHDWLSSDSLFDEPSGYRAPSVRTQVKGDLTCASVAAASVLAKVDRDEHLTRLDQRFPAYGWAGNKGYGSPGHQQAIRELGVTEFHRVSWNIQ
jgi:ribonuclease HII